MKPKKYTGEMSKTIDQLKALYDVDLLNWWHDQFH